MKKLLFLLLSLSLFCGYGFSYEATAKDYELLDKFNTAISEVRFDELVKIDAYLLSLDGRFERGSMKQRYLTQLQVTIIWDIVLRGMEYGLLDYAESVTYISRADRLKRKNSIWFTDNLESIDDGRLLNNNQAYSIDSSSLIGDRIYLKSTTALYNGDIVASARLYYSESSFATSELKNISDVALQGILSDDGETLSYEMNIPNLSKEKDYYFVLSPFDSTTGEEPLFIVSDEFILRSE